MVLEFFKKAQQVIILNTKLIIAVLRWILKAMFQFSPVIIKPHKTLSYCSTTCRAPMIYATLSEKLFEMADKYPDHVLYIFHKNNSLKLTAADVKDRAVRLAQNFLHIGLKKGDRVATLVPNTYELVILYWAAALNGLIIVPLDQDYGSVELEYMIQKTEPSAIVVYNSDEFDSTVNELFPKIDSFQKGKYESEKFPSLKHLIFLKELGMNNQKVWTWTEVADRGLNKGPAYEFPLVDPEDVYIIMFTSGTTGRPKGIICTQFKLLNNYNIFSEVSLITKAMNMTTCVSNLMYHIGAIAEVLRVMFADDGYTVVFPSLKLDVVDMLESIQKYKCNAFMGLPKICHTFINHPTRKNYDLSCLSIVIGGGQIVTADLIKQFKDELDLKVFFIGYGSTETNGGIGNPIYLKSFNPDTYRSCVGKPLSYYECKIVDSEGRVVPLNVEGELHMRGANITRGYWNDEEKTKEAFDVNGWYNTGDFFSMDKDANFYIRSRRKELITAKGSDRLDIYPVEIEESLLKHSNVIEAIAFGVSINKYEQEICAWVKLKSNEIKTSPEELIQFCLADRFLADYKVPKYIKIVNDFPTTNMGKYLRRAMQDEYKNELGI